MIDSSFPPKDYPWTRYLVVLGVLGVAQVKHDRRVRLGATAVGKLAREVDAAVEAEAAVVEDVNVQGLEVGGRVDDANVARLHKVVGHDQVLLVRGELEVVRPDGGLHLVRVVEPLDVAQVADVQRRDVVGQRQREVGEAPVLGDVGAGGEMLLVVVLWVGRSINTL